MAKRRGVAAVGLVVAVLGAGALPASAPQTSEPALPGTGGDALFRTYCASCHGKSAKGDGPLAESLRYSPADLTLIARRNRGKFDPEKVRGIVDGRERVKGHGDTDMPVWGDAFKRSVDGYSEQAVKARIVALVDFLKSIQAK